MLTAEEMIAKYGPGTFIPEKNALALPKSTVNAIKAAEKREEWAKHQHDVWVAYEREYGE